MDSSKTRIVSLGNLDHTILAYKNAGMASMRIQSVLLHKFGREQVNKKQFATFHEIQRLV